MALKFNRLKKDCTIKKEKKRVGVGGGLSQRKKKKKKTDQATFILRLCLRRIKTKIYSVWSYE